MILLRSATRITHKAQGVTCLAAKWHVCATIDVFEATEGDTETPTVGVVGDQLFPEVPSSDTDDVGDEEDELDNTKLIPSYAYSTISFQKRQALGKSVELFKIIITLTKPIMGIDLNTRARKMEGLINGSNRAGSLG